MLTRPIGLPFVVVAAVVLMTRLRRWRLALAFILPTVVIVGGWIARNQLRAGFGGLAGVGDYNLYYCNAATLRRVRLDAGTNAPPPHLVVRPDGPEAFSPEPDLLNAPRFLRECRRQGSGLILARPVSYAARQRRTETA